MVPPAAVLVEACVDSVASARHAEAGGARRLELCDNLSEGGSTPSFGMLETVRERVTLPLHVLIRPRRGDFVYDGDEMAVMLRDVALARRIGADGVVIGALELDGQVDLPRTGRLADAARPMAVTFHRAFDLTRDPAEALETLIALGIERVLTSGQAETAEAGIPVIAEMVAQAAGRITVLAGGGIDETNARRIVRDTGVPEIHVRGSREGKSPMRFRRDGVRLGNPLPPDEYRRVETEMARVRQIVSSVNGAAVTP